jgi:iron complex transport system substrate-binding protein
LLKPDYIFLLVPLQEDLVVKLNQLGFKVVAFPGKSIDGLIWTVREMGRLLDKEDRANRLADRLESEKRALEERMPPRRVRVFAEFMYNPPYTVGGDTYLSELIYLAGGINIFSEREGNLIRVTDEEVIERNPQVILIFHRDASRNIWQRTGWENTDAAKYNRIYFVKDVNLLTLPSHRFREAVEFLKTCFFGKR